MSTVVNFNNKKTFDLLNGESIDFDFSFNEFSPNPSFVSDFLMEFVCSPSQDPIAFINNWIKQHSIIKSIPCTLLNTNVQISGQAKLSSSQNKFVFGQGKETKYDILFEPNVNNFFDKAKNLGFSAFSQQSDWVKIRYITETNNKLEDAVLIAISVQMTITVAQLTYNTVDAIKEAISTGFDTGSSIIKTALKISMNIVYLSAVIVAYASLLKQLSEILFDKPKQYYALDVWGTIQKGCKYLGYQFNSSLVKDFANLTYLPATTSEGKVTGTPLNNPTMTISLMDFIERIGQMFNAKMKVLDNVITFETVTYYEQNPSNVQLLSLYNEGEQTFNFEDLPQKISLQYTKNPSDNNYKNNRYIAEFFPTFSEKQLFNVENAIDITFPFALGQRKTEQSSLEKIFNSLFDILQGLSKNYKIKIGDRIGFLKLQQDFVTVDTIFIRDGEKIKANSNDLLSSKNLYEKYYVSEEPTNSQFISISGRDAQPICGIATAELLKNNVIKDAEGRTIIVTSNIKNSRDNLYEISYRRRLKQGDFGFIPLNLIRKETLSENNT